MNDKLLTKFILSFLIEKEDYLTLKQEQQTIVFETCKTMTAIYNAIKYENVHPVIMCGDVEAFKVIKNSITNVSEYLPSVEKIKIHLIQ